MSGEAAGAVPDDVIDAVAQVIHANDGTLRSIARDVLSVPAVAEAFARDAKVRVVLKKWEHDFRGDSDGVAMDAISDIYEDVPLDEATR